MGGGEKLSLNGIPAETIYHLIEDAHGKEMDWNQFFYVMLTDMDAQVALADTKAQLVMAGSAIMLAAIGIDQGAANDLLLHNGGSWLERLSFICLLLTFATLTLAIFYALKTAQPKLGHSLKASNPLFFNHIALMKLDEYQAMLFGLSMDDMKHFMGAQLHSKAMVIEEKFRTIHRSLNFLFFSLLLWGISRLLLAFAS